MNVNGYFTPAKLNNIWNLPVHACMQRRRRPGRTLLAPTAMNANKFTASILAARCALHELVCVCVYDCARSVHVCTYMSLLCVAFSLAGWPHHVCVFCLQAAV